MRDGRERELLEANNRYLERARRAERRLVQVEDECARANRRCDMYHGQCDRQADRLSILRLHLSEMVAAFRPFTAGPVGAPDSPARIDQENQRRVHTEAVNFLADDLLTHPSRPRSTEESVR